MKRKANKVKQNKFKTGDVVVWDSTKLNPEFWNNLTEKDRKKYYSRLGYNSKKLKLFVFITEIFDRNIFKGKRLTSGHCVLVDLDSGSFVTMCHTDEFRLVKEEEF